MSSADENKRQEMYREIVAVEVAGILELKFSIDAMGAEIVQDEIILDEKRRKLDEATQLLLKKEITLKNLLVSNHRLVVEQQVKGKK